jgi:pyridoxal phosphate-dependent aminotransferase EpsN
LMGSLDTAGIESRPVWKPMHQQTLYAGARCYGGSVADDLFRRGICLPSSSSLTVSEQWYVIDQVRRAAIAGGLSGAATDRIGEPLAVF